MAGDGKAEWWGASICNWACLLKELSRYPNMSGYFKMHTGIAELIVSVLMIKSGTEIIYKKPQEKDAY